MSSMEGQEPQGGAERSRGARISVLVGAVLALVVTFGICAQRMHEIATDGVFRRNLPVKVGMTEVEITAMLGDPAEVVEARDAPAKAIGNPSYAFAAYAGSCGDLPVWDREKAAAAERVPASKLPIPKGKLLWFYGKSVLAAGYYLDEGGRLTCVVLGRT